MKSIKFVYAKICSDNKIEITIAIEIYILIVKSETKKKKQKYNTKYSVLQHYLKFEK